MRKTHLKLENVVLFNSFIFLVFIAGFFLGWPWFRRCKNRRWMYLIAASFVFYGWWNCWFLLLIIGSGLIDFFAGLAIHRWPLRKKIFLIASILANLGSLAIFKYLDFFLANINTAMTFFGSERVLPSAHLILPIGISFYTFQSMSYTIDVYRQNLQPTRNIFHFFAYLSMFPQLVAGPIVRASDLLPQLENAQPTTEEQRWSGMTLIVYGFFKKVVVADTLAPVVSTAFGTQNPLQSCPYWWVIMVLFAFQIYCDFSGYSDIARGLAKWMGYEFPLNFNHPYIAGSFREFWSRWHISLSTWFRDYLYYPLGGSRKGFFAAHGNMWITMLVSGLWHGASWTFVIWGALHAFYLSIERVTQWPAKLAKRTGGKFLCVIIVFTLVVIAWVFFRAESFSQAGIIITRLFSFHLWDTSPIRYLIGKKALLLAGLMIVRHAYIYLRPENIQLIPPATLPLLRPLIVSLLLVACLLFRGPGSAFIYFQF